MRTPRQKIYSAAFKTLPANLNLRRFSNSYFFDNTLSQSNRPEAILSQSDSDAPVTVWILIYGIRYQLQPWTNRALYLTHLPSAKCPSSMVSPVLLFEIATLDEVYILLVLNLRSYLRKFIKCFSRSNVIKMKETVTLTLHLNTSNCMYYDTIWLVYIILCTVLCIFVTCYSLC